MIHSALSAAATEFASDRISGSVELAEKAVEIARRAAEGYSPQELAFHFPRLAAALLEAQPSMAAVINAVDELCLAFESGQLRDTLERVEEDLRSTADKTVEAAAEALFGYKTIATYSRSSLVERTLLKMGEKRPLKVLLAESRPACEGLKLAKNLLAAGIEVTICEDIILPELLKKSEVLVLGADAVGADWFANKTGSCIMCRAAAEAEIKVIIIANSYKFLPAHLSALYHIPGWSYERERMVSIPKAEYFSPLFEKCPLDYVNSIVFEGGAIPVSEIKSLIVKTEISTTLKNYLENRSR